MNLKNINKKNLCYVGVLILLIIVVILLNRTNNGEEYLKGNKKLYDIAIDYLKEEDTKDSINNKRIAYKNFYSYDGLGITKNSKYKYAYMWILKESYHLEQEEKKSDSAYSMFFKFTFKDDKVIKYENPKDGGEYSASIKKMSIDNKMSNKILKYNSKLSNEKQINTYYNKVTNPKKLTKRDIMGDNKLLFTISKTNNKCTPVQLNIYDEGKYELYTNYKKCTKKNCTSKYEYTKKKNGKYNYDAIKIIKYSKNADLLSPKEKEKIEYSINTGKTDIVSNMSTDSNNKYLKEFLKNTKLDLNTCAKAE